ncbi:MAG TPA: class I SAM-dependent methyltransferase [Chitinophagaceae bacterium]|nr:class I SAM-dependent methyltransferase [Chitinophagaceae bacterium]
MPESFHTLCLVCNGANIQTLNGYERHGLVKCGNCGFVFMKKIPTSTELENYYSVYAYENEKEIPGPTRLSLENLLDSFEKYRQNNRILDVGCGEGWILELAMKRGWETYGTEFSSRAIEICEKKGIKMYTGILNPANMKEKDFDIIVSSETIEHINNPREELANIYQLLRKGGLFYITTPNFNSYLRRMMKDKYAIIKYPEHLSYYTTATLNKVLKQTGFSKVKLLTTGISVSHYQLSKETESKRDFSKKTADEKLRNKIARSTALQGIKKGINAGLSLLKIGMTLKAFYTKK